MITPCSFLGLEDAEDERHRIDAKIMENIGYKILLIEDDKLDQMAFKRLVKDKELPYDCTIAARWR